ncbi:MAG: thioredoxin domain-containing protein [Deltaproteobacteria bacterium]|nr:thioredoxin domain-containing protein [Deltaproteobacteria bacterium]
MRKRLTILATLAFAMASSALATAKALPWKELDRDSSLMPNERDEVAALLETTKSYHRCKKSVLACLASNDPIAWRIARYVVFLSGKGLSKAEIQRALELRQESALPKTPKKIPLTGAPKLGPQKPQVTIVEYADFQCGHCAEVSPLLKKIVARYSKQVALVFKPYPLRPGAAVIAARAALAAQRQGKFWQLHDLLFARPQDHTDQGVKRLAKQAGLDLARFAADFADKQLLKQIDLTKVEGIRLGIRGTPTVYVNGKQFKLIKDERHLNDRIGEELEMLR